MSSLLGTMTLAERNVFTASFELRRGEATI